MMKSKFIGIIFLLRFLFFIPGSLFAEEYYVQSYDYYLNIPVSWPVYSAEREDYLVFQDKAGQAIFQVQTIHDIPAGTKPAEVCRNILSGLKPVIESADFFYNNHASAYGTVEFSMNGNPVSGFFVCIEIEGTYVLLFSYVPKQFSGPYMPIMLSCLDGFSLSLEGLRRPGPVSQFYYPFPGPESRRFTIRFQDSAFQFSIDPGSIDASQVMIEREASILANLKKLDTVAWKRYYQMIYRDSYSRLSPAAEYIKNRIRGKDNYTVASELLAWLQQFTYLRTGTVSDLQAPVQSLITRSGDCDSLGLLYCIILDYLGIDAVLMVSAEYGHSIVGVDVPGKGARFPFEGKQYLVAELTDDVALGLIDRQMADPEKWIPIPFR